MSEISGNVDKIRIIMPDLMVVHPFDNSCLYNQIKELKKENKKLKSEIKSLKLKLKT